MFALRQVYDDLPETLSVPIDLRHRKTEVIFIALDSDEPISAKPALGVSVLASLAGSWEGDLEREPQGEFETRRELE
jgi:hypothetical protein